MKIRFKRNIFGQQVLQIGRKIPDNFPGNWVILWKNATQDDIVKFMSELELTKEKLRILERIRDENPELLI